EHDAVLRPRGEMRRARLHRVDGIVRVLGPKEAFLREQRAQAEQAQAARRRREVFATGQELPFFDRIHRSHSLVRNSSRLSRIRVTAVQAASSTLPPAFFSSSGWALYQSRLA